jgi:TolB protein
MNTPRLTFNVAAATAVATVAIVVGVAAFDVRAAAAQAPQTSPASQSPGADSRAGQPLAQPLARLALSDVIRAPGSVSADGRYVALESAAPLSPEDTNPEADIYVLDRRTNRVTLETMAFDGGAANGASSRPRLSGDGRWIVFESSARNLVPESSERTTDLYLRDREAQTTRRLIPVDESTRPDRLGFDETISSDGRVVVFASFSRGLIPGAPTSAMGSDVFVMSTETGEITRVDVTTTGLRPLTGSAFAPSVSGDGRVVAFTATADLETGGPLLSRSQVYVRDLAHGVTRLVSATPAGRPANDASYSASISADGRLVAFVSNATDLGPEDENHLSDVYVRDLESGTITLVSRTSRGRAANGASVHPALSGDGRFVAFVTEASDLTCTRRCAVGGLDNNLLPDVYLADLRTGVMQRLSGDAEAVWWRPSSAPALDAHASVVVFPAREPISVHDVADDFDLFAWIRPPD